MAELTIRLTIDPDTGKKNITVAYQSDADAMPLEHEDEHRRLVDKLIEGGVLSAAEVGTIIVERECDDSQGINDKATRPIARRRSLTHET